MGVTVIVAVLVTLVVAVPLSAFITLNRCKKDSNSKLGEAKRKAEEIIDEAIKDGESKKKEALLEAKEEVLRTKNELEEEIKERRLEMQKLEKRNLNKEETIDKKITELELKKNKLAEEETAIRKKESELDTLKEKQLKELERISGLNTSEAKDILLGKLEGDLHHEMAVLIKEHEEKALDEAERKAKDIVVGAMQRCATDCVSEACVTVVELPSDEMKGRIIGREGRNIRALENETGVELIIDDTPEAVVLSSFEPIRREIAKIALEKLIVDGRIHPTRIEEMVEKAHMELENSTKEKGDAVVLELGITGIHPELIRLLGRMQYRTSYGQNALRHSMEVSEIAGIIAGELGEDVRLAKRAGLLHDIGKSIDRDVEGSHVEVGAQLCRKYKESDVVINAVESHHDDKESTNIISEIIKIADAISASRPGARRDNVESYTNRLKELEEIAGGYEGVEKTFAIQAGREVRVIVVPDKVNEDDMVILARKIAGQIESELTYPGQVKVNVIRETRAVDVAK